MTLPTQSGDLVNSTTLSPGEGIDEAFESARVCMLESALTELGYRLEMIGSEIMDVSGTGYLPGYKDMNTYGRLVKLKNR